MEDLLLSTSIVGSSVSILFSLSTVVVLSCYKEKARTLRMKQHFSITLVLTNIIVLAGFQGLSSRDGCRLVTILLHYIVIVSFAWISFDTYYVATTIRRKTLVCQFGKAACIIWVSPIPFIVLALILGLALDSKIGSHSKAYKCWNSDHIIWSLVIPCCLAVLISIYFLIVGTYASYVIYGPTITSSRTIKRLTEASRYGLKTNFSMLTITTLIWIFGCQTFWHPQTVNFQLVFGLGAGVQGLFVFFFYCVFCLELDLHLSDDSEKEFHEVKYDDLNGVTVKKVTRKKTSIFQLAKTLDNVNEDENCYGPNNPKEYNKRFSEVHSSLGNLDELKTNNPGTAAEQSDYSSTSTPAATETIAMVHKMNSLKNNEELISLETKLSSLDAGSSNSNTYTETYKTDTTKNQNNKNKTSLQSNENIFDQMNFGAKPTQTLHNQMKIETSLCDANRKHGANTSYENVVMSTASVTSSADTQNRRTSSKTSNTSFASNMGMNELESLFNNPDLMNQTLPSRQSRNSSNRLDRSGGDQMSNSCGKPKTSRVQEKILEVPPTTSTVSEYDTKAQNEDTTFGMENVHL